jgi:hypothetical protein
LHVQIYKDFSYKDYFHPAWVYDTFATLPHPDPKGRQRAGVLPLGIPIAIGKRASEGKVNRLAKLSYTPSLLFNIIQRSNNNIGLNRHALEAKDLNRKGRRESQSKMA